MQSAAHTSPAAHQHAFTVVELLVVMLIIGIIGGIAYPAMRGWQASARRDGGVSAAREYARSIDSFARDHAGRPPTLGAAEWTSAGVKRGPFDASTGKRYLLQVPEPMQNRDVQFQPGASARTPIVLNYWIGTPTQSVPARWSLRVSERRAGRTDRVICQFGTRALPSGVPEC